MHEGHALERTVTFDRAVHMHAAFRAGMTLDEGSRIDDRDLAAVFDDLDIVCRRGDDREDGTFGLPALDAAARVVMGDVAFDADLDGLLAQLQTSTPPEKAASVALNPLSMDGCIAMLGMGFSSFMAGAVCAADRFVLRLRQDGQERHSGV